MVNVNLENLEIVNALYYDEYYMRIIDFVTSIIAIFKNFQTLYIMVSY